jgi:hypothetical protein
MGEAAEQGSWGGRTRSNSGSGGSCETEEDERLEQ